MSGMCLFYDKENVIGHEFDWWGITVDGGEEAGRLVYCQGRQVDNFALTTANKTGRKKLFGFGDVVNLFLTGQGLQVFEPGVDVRLTTSPM